MLNANSLQFAFANGAGALPEPVAENLLSRLNSGDYLAAARLASAAFQDGCTDVRCIAAMLLGTFVERGPESIPEIFSMIRYLLGDGWNALEPTSRKSVMADGALTQVLRSIKTLIDFHESVRDRVWEQWRTTIGERLRPDSEQVGRELERAILRLGEHNRSAVALAALQTKISAAFTLAGSTESSRAKSSEAASALDVDHTAVAESEETSALGTQDGLSTGSVGGNDSLVPDCVEISPELARFIQQLEAFAVLVERGDLTRAAIVAYDVRKTIESFDPVRFLPSLFASHFQLLGSKIDQIAVLWEQEGTPQWQVLVQHYRADLRGFVQG